MGWERRHPCRRVSKEPDLAGTDAGAPSPVVTRSLQLMNESRNPNDKRGSNASASASEFRPSSVVIPHFKKHFREWSVALALLALLLLLAVLAPGFFQKSQLLSICSTAVPVLLVASGVALVIISRQIDISLGSQFAVCSVLLGLLVQAHWPMPLAAIAAIAAGACCGAFNGLLIAGLGLPSIVVTLATMVTWREGLRWWRQGEFGHDLPDSFQWFGLGQAGRQKRGLVSAALVFALLTIGMKYLSGGRSVYAVGSD